MRYVIVWEDGSRHDMLKLDRAVALRIYCKLQAISQDPRRYVNKLVGRDGYRLRVGDWRVILDIDDAKKIVVVRLVGHRGKVYDNLNS